MRKYFSVRSQLLAGIAILLFAILPGCEKDFGEIIDVSTADYQVTGTSSFDSFTYVVGDSSITIFLILNSSDNVTRIFCDVIASDGNKINSNPVVLLDNGNVANGDQTARDNRFTNFFALSQQNPVGAYIINYYVVDNLSITKRVAVQKFNYDNGQTNVAPVISNLILPDSIAKGIPFNFSVTVNDANGLIDIDKQNGVFFILYRPDSTLVPASPFFMHDDGNPVFGDDTADDGIFSFRNSFLDDSTTQTGNWKFIFQARDRGGLLSNILEKFLIVTE